MTWRSSFRRVRLPQEAVSCAIRIGGAARNELIGHVRRCQLHGDGLGCRGLGADGGVGRRRLETNGLGRRRFKIRNLREGIVVDIIDDRKLYGMPPVVPGGRPLVGCPLVLAARHLVCTQTQSHTRAGTYARTYVRTRTHARAHTQLSHTAHTHTHTHSAHTHTHSAHTHTHSAHTAHNNGGTGKDLENPPEPP